MAYLIGLFLVLAVIFSSFGGSNMIGNFFSRIKDNAGQTLFPKTAKEILIENISSDYQDMDKFFSEVAPALLNSKNVSEKDKTEIKKAVAAFNGSKSLVSNLSELEKEDKSLIKAIIEKVLNLDEESGPEPTSIPPQCKLVCGE